jgi:hypothetical protein
VEESMARKKTREETHGDIYKIIEKTKDLI